MFEIDGKVFRNIQEQVQKNKSDIAAIRNVETVLNEFGVTVLGKLDTEAEIPEGTYNYGDAYLIGTEEPYDMYIYTRDDADGSFINIGPLNIVGPSGPAGTITVGTVSTGNAGAQASVTNVGTPENAILNFTIPRGNIGATGNGIYTITKTDTIGLVDTYTISYTDGTSTTFTVTNGQAGTPGTDGDPGESFMIMGVISNTSLLPDPSITPRNYAYVYNDGDSTTPDKLYYITGSIGNEIWSYSSFAAAGTTVTVNSSPVYTFNADTKQDTLVSGTNIKTINNESLLGSGDITIASGATVVDLGTITFSSDSVNISGNETDYNTLINNPEALISIKDNDSPNTTVYLIKGNSQPDVPLVPAQNYYWSIGNNTYRYYVNYKNKYMGFYTITITRTLAETVTSIGGKTGSVSLGQGLRATIGFRAIEGVLPECSQSTDGDYALQCNVASGTKTYSWAGANTGTTDFTNANWTAVSAGNYMWLDWDSTYQIQYRKVDGAGYEQIVSWIVSIPKKTDLTSTNQRFNVHDVQFVYPASGLAMYQLGGIDETDSTHTTRTPRFSISYVTWSSFNNQGGFVTVQDGTMYYRKIR